MLSERKYNRAVKLSHSVRHTDLELSAVVAAVCQDFRLVGQYEAEFLKPLNLICQDLTTRCGVPILAPST